MALAGKIKIMIVGLLVAGGAALGIATAGTASANSAQCAAGHFCFWETSPFSGHFDQVTKGTNLAGALHGFVWAGKLTDVRNLTGHNWCIYTQVSGFGRAELIPNGWEGYVGASFNDKVYSVYPTQIGGTPC